VYWDFALLPAFTVTRLTDILFFILVLLAAVELRMGLLSTGTISYPDVTRDEINSTEENFTFM
jgi:hypothetical protein